MRASLRESVPLVVTEGKRICWVNECGVASGIVEGMAESGAQALAANLVLVPRDCEAEAAAMTEAALWALHFTPEVAMRPMGLLLSVAASLRLFGGVHTIMDKLRNGLIELGFTPSICAAPTATAAWLFAQVRDGHIADNETLHVDLDSLPVQLLESVATYADTLEAIGCERIGQLRRLPRAGLAKRFGKEVLQELDRAIGSEPELFRWYEPPEQFQQCMELGARVETTELLLGPANRLLMQMTGFLTARHCAVSRFALMLHHERLRRGQNNTTRVEVILGSPSRDLSHLLLLLKEHLAKQVLNSSVIELSLHAEDLQTLAAPNTELFPTIASEAESVGRLIERLASRLGHNAIQRLAIVADHRPERCSTMLQAHERKNVRRNATGCDYPPRPTWLLKEPIPLHVRNNRPFYQSPLKLLIGPERVESGWWDDQVIARDYFVAMNDANLLLWIYRERMGADETEPGWFLHGLYA